uniref:Uncharacterized protein n=1 Tax=Leptospirillum ferrodiazotrophum TaxID=412449 RepID=C6HXD2_9BACT|nr:MAG: hypothetical protein UBAL3_92050055 [Leptospirillum ferrodiazotrophum]
MGGWMRGFLSITHAIFLEGCPFTAISAISRRGYPRNNAIDKAPPCDRDALHPILRHFLLWMKRGKHFLMVPIRWNRIRCGENGVNQIRQKEVPQRHPPLILNFYLFSP